MTFYNVQANKYPLRKTGVQIIDKAYLLREIDFVLNFRKAVSIFMHHTRFLRSSLDTEARQEEENIHMCSGAFTAYYSKQRKKSFWILTIAMFGVSILSTIGGISSFIVSELTATGLICLIVLFFRNNIVKLFMYSNHFLLSLLC